jgi:hypothetical protein
MGRSLAWLLVLVAVSGCLDRRRVNVTCEWTGDSVFPIDSQNPGQRQHLVADAQLAEEVAIRYADREHLRRFGTEAHGGLIDQGRLRQQCMSRMVDAIRRNHQVTAEQVQVARGQRNQALDLAAGLTFLPIYAFGSFLVCGWLRRRFSLDGPTVWLVATGLASTVASVVGLQAGQLWSSVWEVGRVGNGHISAFRMATNNRWSQHHVGTLFLAGVVLFWIVALLRYRRAARFPQG